MGVMDRSVIFQEVNSFFMPTYRKETPFPWLPIRKFHSESSLTASKIISAKVGSGTDREASPCRLGGRSSCLDSR
jgi:hypothetical protein